MFRCTAGLAHMSGFMAGAISTGPRRTRYNVDTKSSAKPCAAFARKSAVAGAMQNSSARSASVMWAPNGKSCGSNTSQATGRPERAAKRGGRHKLAGRCASSRR